MATQESYLKTHRIAGDHVTIDLPSRIEELRALLPGHGHRSETVYKEAGLTLVLIAMERNDVIPAHSAGGSSVLHVLEGGVRLLANGVTTALGPGQVAAFGPGVAHEVRARDESMVLLTVAALAEVSYEDQTPMRGAAQ